MDRLQRWSSGLEERIWGQDVDAMPPMQKQLWLTLRMVWAIAHDLSDPQFTLRVMGLVYTTLLSLVPFLALGFSLLKAFDVHSLAEPLLLKLFEPFGTQAPQMVQTLVGFINNIKVGVLGTVGLGLLLFSAISLIQKVESGFNFVWKVQRARNLLRRFSEYLSVLVVGPLVLVSVLGLTGALSSNTVVNDILSFGPLGFVLSWVGRLLPYLLICGVFTFLYMFMPNTRVRIRAALVGGLFAGIAWQTASFIFAEMVGRMTTYNAIYSGFAILIFLLIWLYIGWLILLIGCRVSYLVQNPETLKRLPHLPALGLRLYEQVALAVMTLVGQRFMTGKTGWQQTELTRCLRLPPEYVNAVVDCLVQRGWLVEAGEDQPLLMPTQDLHQASVARMLEDLRSMNRGWEVQLATAPALQAAEQLMQGLDAARRSTLEGVTLATLAEGPALAPHQKA